MSSTTTSHPDYELMQRVYDELENSVPEGWEDRAHSPEQGMSEMQEVLGGDVDAESLHRFCSEHANAAMIQMLPGLMLGTSDPASAFGALYASAFMAGLKFQQAGGHTTTEAQEV